MTQSYTLFHHRNITYYDGEINFRLHHIIYYDSVDAENPVPRFNISLCFNVDYDKDSGDINRIPNAIYANDNTSELYVGFQYAE